MSTILPKNERKNKKNQSNSTKITNSKDTSGWIVFVHVLEELRIPKSTFEINCWA